MKKKKPKYTPATPYDIEGISFRHAAICRDLVEGGYGTRYFGSTLGFMNHLQGAVNNGLVTNTSVGFQLTKRGKKLGELCRDIPGGRACGFHNEYNQAILALLESEGFVNES